MSKKTKKTKKRKISPRRAAERKARMAKKTKIRARRRPAPVKAKIKTAARSAGLFAGTRGTRGLERVSLHVLITKTDRAKLEELTQKHKKSATQVISGLLAEAK